MKNETLMQYFEWDLPADGLLWKRCKAQAPKLKEAGITKIWLPPAYKGMNGIYDVGYGVYDTYDLGEFEQKGTVATKYGTREEYLDAVKTLQKNGLEVLADVVLNHMLGADGCEPVTAREIAENNRNQVVADVKEISAWTIFDFPGRNGKYSDFKWNSSHFNGVDWDENAKKKALYLFEGKHWDEETDEEKANYDYLMGADLDMDNAAVRAQLVKWGLWYEETVGMDGFRLDAVKHINAGFYKDWLSKIREKTGKPMFAVAEYWHADIKRLLKYLDRVENCMLLFDVPLHFNFYNASHQGGTYDMRYLLDNTLVEHRSANAVTFVDNHDTQPGQALCSYVQGWFKPLAYACILFRQDGIPCVFYGDYYGLPSQNIPPMSDLPKMIKIRELYAYGEQNDYFDHENVIGWVRMGDEEYENSGLAVVLSDGPGGTKRMFMGRHFAGMKFKDVTGKCLETIQIDEEGWGDFRVEGGSVSAWVCREAYEFLETHIA